MILGAALLLAQAAPPAAAAPPAGRWAAPAVQPLRVAPPALRPMDAGQAVETFRAICWTHVREPDDVAAAVPAAATALAEVPRTRPGPTRTWRADDAILTYTAADDLPAGAPARQCMLRTRLAGAADQLTLAARVATALALTGGVSRTGPGGAQTTWDVRQPDGRTLRLIVATANAAGGQTDLRQLALLLSPR